MEKFCRDSVTRKRFDETFSILFCEFIFIKKTKEFLKKNIISILWGFQKRKVCELSNKKRIPIVL
jgi:hypothetical protein